MLHSTVNYYSATTKQEKTMLKMSTIGKYIKKGLTNCAY